MGEAGRGDTLYEMGTRAIILERSRVGIGELFALDETPREPLYAVRFNDERRMMFWAHEVVAYREARYETLDAVLRAIFDGFRAEDGADAPKSKPLPPKRQ